MLSLLHQSPRRVNLPWQLQQRSGMRAAAVTSVVLTSVVCSRTTRICSNCSRAAQIGYLSWLIQHCPTPPALLYSTSTALLHQHCSTPPSTPITIWCQLCRTEFDASTESEFRERSTLRASANRNGHTGAAFWGRENQRMSMRIDLGLEFL